MKISCIAPSIRPSPLFCPVCHENYSDEKCIPKMLACGNNHSACDVCLDRILEGTNPKCPLCQVNLSYTSSSAYRTNNDIIETFTYYSNLIMKPSVLCLASCCECKGKFNEKMFVVCKTCTKPENSAFFNNEEAKLEGILLSNIDNIGICYKCFNKNHKSHSEIEFVKLRSTKVANEMKASLISFERERNRLILQVQQIIPLLMETEKLSNDLAKVAECAPDSAILEEIQTTFEKDVKHVSTAVKVLQEKLMTSFLSELKLKVDCQKTAFEKLMKKCPKEEEEKKAERNMFFIFVITIFHVLNGLVRLFYKQFMLFRTIKKEE